MLSAVKVERTRVSSEIYFRAGGVREGGVYVKTRGMKNTAMAYSKYLLNINGKKCYFS